MKPAAHAIPPIAALEQLGRTHPQAARIPAALGEILLISGHADKASRTIRNVHHSPICSSARAIEQFM